MLIDVFLSMLARVARSTWEMFNGWDSGPVGVVVDMTRGIYNTLALEPVGAILGLVDVGMMHTVAVYLFTLLPIVILIRVFVTAVGALLPGGIS